MVTFSDHITGAAARFYMRKFWIETLTIGFPVLVGTILVTHYIGLCILHDPYFIKVMTITVLIASLICLLIYTSKKMRMALLPQLIYTEGETITCVSETYTEVAHINDVSKVVDHGDFYQLVFPYGKKTNKFICQKDLLTRGSLAEFEALFIGKIERKTE